MREGGSVDSSAAHSSHSLQGEAEGQALANFIHSPLHTPRERRGVRRRERGAEGEAKHFCSEQDSKLDKRPTFLRLQGNLCCCSPVVPVFQCMT